MGWIACRWCHVRINLSGDKGWHTCECKTVSVDIGNGYYRVISNLEDIEEFDLLDKE